MNLSMTGALAAAYRSGAQRARVVTEAWGEKNLFCPNCSSPKLTWLEPGHPASDYSCPACGFWYQLKSQRAPIRSSINDGAYRAMMDAIHNDALPSMYFMQYDLATWRVRNLLLVPHFAFPPSAIIKRKPLAATARRAGWVGCNFDLRRIPAEARIDVVRTMARQRSAAVSAAGFSTVPVRDATRGETPRRPAGVDACATVIVPPEEVRDKFKRVIPLKEISIQQRGWTLDVLNTVRRLVESRRRGKESLIEKPREDQSLLTSAPTGEFTTADAYTFTRELEKLHPDNRHVKDKIRQQLQVLRDAGLLIHVGRGVWRLP
ncbi:MAG TPA: DpnI domain-containing protein [Verrucomicrobiae bacterium]|nr:DpnI domain-containing protein [Verrucomicrobiae bacterium]